MNMHDIPKAVLDQVGKVQNISFPPRQGHTSKVAILTTPDNKYVIKKTEHELYNQWLSDEFKALRYLSETNLFVPEVHGYVEDERSGWLLMDYIDGISLREFLARNPSSKVKEKAISSFGLCLRNIHECSCPSEFSRKDEEWLDTALRKAEFNLKHYDVDGTEELLRKLNTHEPAAHKLG